jgi:hypothetical protein
LVVLILAGAPRIAVVLLWLFRPFMISTAFDSIIVPILGVIFLPWLTLMYVLVSPGGIQGFDWALLGLGLFLDLGSYGGGRASRDRRSK